MILHRLAAWRPRRWLGVAALALGLMFTSAVSWAMRVSPMVAEMTTTGAGSAARIEVGNVGATALPFETMITRLDIDENGEFVETPADENFLVFPPQGVVGVGGRQVMRVQWVGEPNLNQSHAYYLWVKQLPLPTEAKPPEESGGGQIAVTVLYTMKALLVVAPNGAEPRVELVSAKPAMISQPVPEVDPELSGGARVDAPPAEPGVEIVVTNTGNRYALMSGATWIIEGVAKDGSPYRRELKSGDLSAMVGVGYLPPSGGRRTFQVPTGGVELDPARPISVRFAQ